MRFFLCFKCDFWLIFWGILNGILTEILNGIFGGFSMGFWGCSGGSQGVSGCSPDPRTFWNLLEPSGTFWNILESPQGGAGAPCWAEFAVSGGNLGEVLGVSGCSPDPRTFWNVLELSGMFRNPLSEELAPPAGLNLPFLGGIFWDFGGFWGVLGGLLTPEPLRTFWNVLEHSEFPSGRSCPSQHPATSCWG